MQLRKILGLSLLYLGIILIIFGLLAMSVPHVENEQVRMILASFEAPAVNPVVGFINQQFLNMIRYSLSLTAVGGGLSLLGGIFLFSLRGQREEKWTEQRPVPSERRASKPLSFPPSAPSAPSGDSFQGASAWRKNTSPLSLKDEFPPSDSVPFFIAPKAKMPPTNTISPAEDNPYLSYGQSAYAPPEGAKKEKSGEESLSYVDETVLASLLAPENDADATDLSEVPEAPLPLPRPAYCPGAEPKGTPAPINAAPRKASPASPAKRPLSEKPTLSAAPPLLTPSQKETQKAVGNIRSTIKISGKRTTGAQTTETTKASESKEPFVPTASTPVTGMGGVHPSKTPRNSARIRSTIGKEG